MVSCGFGSGFAPPSPRSASSRSTSSHATKGSRLPRSIQGAHIFVECMNHLVMWFTSWGCSKNRCNYSIIVHGTKVSYTTHDNPLVIINCYLKGKCGTLFLTIVVISPIPWTSLPIYMGTIYNNESSIETQHYNDLHHFLNNLPFGI